MLAKDIPQNRTALIAGATGLVGGNLLNLLLKEKTYIKVKVVVRNKINIENDKLEQHIIDFDNLHSYKDLLKADDVFCCLGTTIKKAGSQKAFRKVDYDYPLELAELSLQNGAKQFLVITSLGANASSKIFYNRVKGELEDELMKMDFRSLNIFRPSLMLGKRAEPRPGEKMGELFFKLFSFLLVKRLKKYRAINASAVAYAMMVTAKEYHGGVDVFESDRIQGFSII